MRLHGFQSRIAQRHAKRLLVASRFAFCTACRRRLRRGCSPPLLGCTRFPIESCQNTLGDFHLIELDTEFFPFAIEPREPLGNPLLLLLHRRRHLLVSPRSQIRPSFAPRWFSTMNAKETYRQRSEAPRIAFRTNF